MVLSPGPVALSAQERIVAKAARLMAAVRILIWAVKRLERLITSTLSEKGAYAIRRPGNLSSTVVKSLYVGLTRYHVEVTNI
jgi:hypothetical protein